MHNDIQIVCGLANKVMPVLKTNHHAFYASQSSRVNKRKSEATFCQSMVSNKSYTMSNSIQKTSA